MQLARFWTLSHLEDAWKQNLFLCEKDPVVQVYNFQSGFQTKLRTVNLRCIIDIQKQQITWEKTLKVKPFTRTINFQLHWPKDCKLLRLHYSEKKCKKREKLN